MAREFARQGCKKLFLVDISAKNLESTKAFIEDESPSAKLMLYEGDVASAKSVEKMVKTCVEIYGRLDFAINNAGVAMGNAKHADLDVKTLDRVCAVNEKGVRSSLVNGSQTHAWD